MPMSRVRKFSNLDELQAFLNGGVRGGKLTPSVGSSSAAIGVGGLAGKTLTFSKPAGTVTFATAPDVPGNDPYLLLPRDIISQIENAMPTLRAVLASGFLLIQERDVSGGVVVAPAAAGSYANVAGTVDLTTVDPAVLNGQTLVTRYNGGSPVTTTFQSRADAVAGANFADAIVNGINETSGAPNLAASRTNDQHLLLRAFAPGANSVKVDGTSTALVALGLSATTATGDASNTANELLGFDTGAETTGTVISPGASPVVAPMLVNITATNDGTYVVITWE